MSTDPCTTLQTQNFAGNNVSEFINPLTYANSREASLIMLDFLAKMNNLYLPALNSLKNNSFQLYQEPHVSTVTADYEILTDRTRKLCPMDNSATLLSSSKTSSDKGIKLAPSSGSSRKPSDRKNKKCSKRSNISKERIYVDRINDTDVLSGRGGKSNNHPGNKRYRQAINDMKLTYSNTKGKLKKTDLSHSIVDHVYQYGGRFIKKDESTDKYFLLTRKEARRKTSQALREHKEIKWTI